VDCVVVFDDGLGGAFKKHVVGGSLDEILQRCRDEIAQQGGGTTFYKEISALIGQPLDLTVAAPTPPDPAREAFSANLRLLRSMARAIADGVMDPGDQGYLDQKAAVITEFSKDATLIEFF
jgi:hypothetical protein